MKILDVLRERDPDLVNLRKAARGMLVPFALFVVLYGVFDFTNIGTYAFFACFVALVFANFGGPFPARAAAYAAMTIIGGLLVVIGALLSGNLFASAVAMFVVVFLVFFSSVFGGYAPAFVPPIALAYSLTVLEPITAASIGDRLVGWVIGGIVALIAAITLWPVNQRTNLSRSLADVASGLASALQSLNDKSLAETHLASARKAMVEARQKASAPLRPAGPTSRQVALLHLVENLEQSVEITGDVLDGGWTPEDHELVSASAFAFGQAGTVLLGELSPDAVAEGMKRLDDTRLARRTSAEALILDAGQKSDEGRVSDGLTQIRRSAPVMALSHITIWVAIDTATALGGNAQMGRLKTTPEVSPIDDSPAQLIQRARHILSGSLDPDGVIFRNSIRAAAAMTLAVVLVQLVPVAHGFWITLGALLVLRSNASATSASALQAIAGTAIGFVVAGTVLLLFGQLNVMLWLLLPIALFFAGYTPNVIGFLVGQVSFTTALVILFSLIDNVGMTTDVTRLETVSIGALSSAVMALILWPRGARSALANAAANLYRATADATRTLITGTFDAREEARRNIRAARRRADEAFGIALNERGRALDTGIWLALARAPNLVASLAHGLLHEPSPQFFENFKPTIDAVARHRDTVADKLDNVATILDPAGGNAKLPECQNSDDLQDELIRCLDSSRSHGRTGVADALALIGLNAQLTNLDKHLEEVQPHVEMVAKVSERTAWLRWAAPKRRSPPTTR